MTCAPWKRILVCVFFSLGGQQSHAAFVGEEKESSSQSRLADFKCVPHVEVNVMADLAKLDPLLPKCRFTELVREEHSRLEPDAGLVDRVTVYKNTIVRREASIERIELSVNPQLLDADFFKALSQKVAVIDGVGLVQKLYQVRVSAMTFDGGLSYFAHKFFKDYEFLQERHERQIVLFPLNGVDANHERALGRVLEKTLLPSIWDDGDPEVASVHIEIAQVLIHDPDLNADLESLLERHLCGGVCGGLSLFGVRDNVQLSVAEQEGWTSPRGQSWLTEFTAKLDEMSSQRRCLRVTTLMSAWLSLLFGMAWTMNRLSLNS